MLSQKILIRILINTFIGVILIGIWLQFVNIEQILSSLSQISFIEVLPILFFVIFTPTIRAFRLKILLSKYVDIPSQQLIFLNGVAQLLNFLIPVRAGEISKGIYLNQAYNLPLAKSLAWIFIDRYIDFVLVIVMAGLLLTFIPTSLPTSFGYGLLLGGIGIISMTYLMVYHQSLARNLFIFIERFLVFKLLKHYFHKTYEFFLDTTSILKLSAWKSTQVIAITLISSLSDTFVMYFAFLALGSYVDYWKVYLGQFLSALTYLIPAAPGYVGSAEASGLLVFSGILGYDRNLASAMIVLFHVCILVAILIYGIISIYGLKVDVIALLRKALKRE